MTINVNINFSEIEGQIQKWNQTAALAKEPISEEQRKVLASIEEATLQTIETTRVAVQKFAEEAERAKHQAANEANIVVQGLLRLKVVIATTPENQKVFFIPPVMKDLNQKLAALKEKLKEPKPTSAPSYITPQQATKIAAAFNNAPKEAETVNIDGVLEAIRSGCITLQEVNQIEISILESEQRAKFNRLVNEEFDKYFKSKNEHRLQAHPANPAPKTRSLGQDINPEK
jgi:hypothetical protein